MWYKWYENVNNKVFRNISDFNIYLIYSLYIISKWLNFIIILGLMYL